ncbi:MAG TPA: hypothetical protein VGA75_02635 [Paracoccaceae bacterium]
MRISFTPMRQDTPLTLARRGDVLVVNGVDYDFSGIPEGATLPRDAVAGGWLASDIERVAGVLHLTLILPHGPRAPEATRFPQPVTLTTDGPVALPPYDAEDAE